MNDLLKYLIENRTKKANSRTINKFKIYLEECIKNGVSIDQIKEEFSEGLTVELFEAQVNDWFN
jgi:hypothetical protein